jgi:phage terminase large subunit GpA-like protein
LNALYSPWVKMSGMAREFLLAMGRPDLMQNFRNSKLAEPFEEQVSRIVIENLEGAEEPAEVVPTWALCVVVTADTQKKGFPFVARAWGARMRSRLVAWGMAKNKEELSALATKRWKVAENKGYLPTKILLVDSGGGIRNEEAGIESSTDLVYRFAMAHPGLVFATKGNSKPQGKPIASSRVNYKPPGAGRSPYDVHLQLIDTSYFKGLLMGHIQAKPGEEKEWQISQAASDEYLAQVKSEHQIIVAGGGIKWEKISAGRANHALDCEVLQLAAVDMLGLAMVPEDLTPEYVDRAEPVGAGQATQAVTPQRPGVGMVDRVRQSRY